MRTVWILALGWMLTAPWALSAQTALSVEDNALWRVDLRSQDLEWVADLGTADPDFDCWDLAVSPAGTIRCIADDQLYAIEPGATSALAALPAPGPSALAFDPQGTLWFAGGNPASLWQIDADTGAVLDVLLLSLEGTEVLALAARGEQIFAFSRDEDFEARLEEVDLLTGGSLSAVELEPFEIFSPADAAFDLEGNLWVTDIIAGIITGGILVRYHRIDLDPLGSEMTWSGAFIVGDPIYINIDAIEIAGSLVEVPALGPAGLALLSFFLVSAAWIVLRRGTI